MPRRQLRPPMALSVAAVILVGCGSTSTAGDVSKGTRPAQVVPIAGTHSELILLTEAASDRLGIQLTPVRMLPGHSARATGAPRTIIPQSAVFYDDKGGTWTFISKDRLAFERQQVAIVAVDGDSVVLQSGPDPGTDVVSIGVDELRGIQDGVGGD